MRRLALLPVLAVLPILVATSGAASAVDTITVGGTIDGSDGRAVNALIGLDVHDANGQTLNADGSVRTTSGYGIVVHINNGTNGQPDLPAEGSADTSTATIAWTAQVPASAANVYIETYPQAANKTNEARYGHAMRHNVPLPTGDAIDIHLPLICAQGGTTGSIRGTATIGGAPQPLKRVVAWSIDPYDAVNRPTLGWTIGTAANDGSYVLPNLASGNRYQVWTTSTDGVVKKTVGVPVSACAETVRDVVYDPPPSAPSGSPAPPAPTVENGSSLITAGAVATLSGAADPGAHVELLAYSRPSTTYSVIRTTAATDTGSYSFSVRPQTNTRLLVRVGGQQSPSVVVAVRPAVSLSAARTGTRTFTFRGRVQPARAGQLVSVFAHTAMGDVMVGQGWANGDGVWSTSHRFTGVGTLDLFAATGRDVVNAAGRSVIARTAVR
ncbi:MAG: hypothetical protein NVSMB55_12680 [Mycobacteriales bacterium]